MIFIPSIISNTASIFINCISKIFLLLTKSSLNFVLPIKYFLFCFWYFNTLSLICLWSLLSSLGKCFFGSCNWINDFLRFLFFLIRSLFYAFSCSSSLCCSSNFSNFSCSSGSFFLFLFLFLSSCGLSLFCFSCLHFH